MMDRELALNLSSADLQDALERGYSGFIDDVLIASDIGSDYYDEDGYPYLDYDQYALASNLLISASALAYRESLSDEMATLLINWLSEHVDPYQIYPAIMLSLNLSSKGYEAIPPELRTAVDEGVCDAEVADLVSILSDEELMALMLYVSDQTEVIDSGFCAPILHAVYASGLVSTDYLFALMAGCLDLPDDGSCECCEDCDHLCCATCDDNDICGCVDEACYGDCMECEYTEDCPYGGDDDDDFVPQGLA